MFCDFLGFCVCVSYRYVLTRVRYFEGHSNVKLYQNILSFDLCKPQALCCRAALNGN